MVLDNKIQAVLPDDTGNGNQRLFSYYSNNKEGASNGNSEQEFGSNFSANSFVYVGGLPSFYSTKLSSLALPSAVFEPRFRGSIRNVVYADDESGRPRRQEVMAYKVGKTLLSNRDLTSKLKCNQRAFCDRSIPYISIWTPKQMKKFEDLQLETAFERFGFHHKNHLTVFPLIPYFQKLTWNWL